MAIAARTHITDQVLEIAEDLGYEARKEPCVSSVSHLRMVQRTSF